MKVSIGCVIVAYNSDLNSLAKVLSATLDQVECLVVVNNGTEPLSFLNELIPQNLIERLFIIENKDNLGVATALNRGIQFLIDKGCSHIIFLDQDSLAPKGMVASLFDTFSKLTLEGAKLAAIGPSFFDINIRKNSPFIRFGKFGFELVFGTDLEPVISTHLLITSGTMTSVDVINDVGLMDDDLFIDYVDNEWCLRAISKGYQLFGDSKVSMEHAIGDKPMTFRNKYVHMHGPVRQYYISRNITLLLKRNYIPLNWRLIMMSLSIKRFIFYSLIPPNRFSNFRMMTKGFYHGVIGKLGKLP